jgi:4a-hydroxytetrahydrobiopterin dehydratase
MKKLSAAEATEQLEKISGWILKNDGIEKDFKFKDFKEALVFINLIGNEAEGMNHHPELFNVYNRIHIRLSTHDAGGLTEKDFELAKRINRIYKPA